MKLTLGEVFAERFRVEAMLGRGGFGTVYAARDQATGRDVALKVLHDVEDHVRRRFEREIKVVGMLTSPYTVRLLSTGRCWAAFEVVLDVTSREL